MSDKSVLQSAFSSDSPSTPSGYILNEVSNYSFTSDNNCVYLENYLIKKLKKNDPVTKFKSLRIIKHLCDKGNPSFKILIQRHASQIRYCQGYKGSYDPVYGDTLSELVREEAIQCLKSIFSNSNKNDCNIKVANGEGMRIIGSNNRIMDNNTNGFGSYGNNVGGVNNYKNRIHGFGNPSFIDKFEYSNKSDISSIGNSIIYNAKIGRYNQVVEDISDLVLKVIPNKLVNGISNYYTNNGNNIYGASSSSSYNRQRELHNISNTIRPNQNIFECNVNNMRQSSTATNFSNLNTINGVIGNNAKINNTQDNLGRFSKFESRKENCKTEPISYVKNDALETSFVENYCLVTGLIVTPSSEQLQNNIKEILKLDVPVVISLLHKKLKQYYLHYFDSGNDLSERDKVHNGSGSSNIDDSKLSPLNNARSDDQKIVYRILCLLLSLLELNGTTKDCLIEYSNDDFIQLLDNVSNYNLQCRKKAKLITEIIKNDGQSNSNGKISDTSETTSFFENTIEITDNLIEIDEPSNENIELESSNSSIINSKEVLGVSNAEKTQETNTLFKNLSIKNRKTNIEHVDNNNNSLLSGTVIDNKQKQSLNCEFKPAKELEGIGSLIDLDF
ncbi:epsin like ENTH domain (alpha-alpha superhelix)involved in vesicular transport [Cryptosporidium xiaoi]|uniref:Epsin like ENTH domain (Alpha-alpha superhelix)involved in vesicular transport n=1 Tax=Cryptosporidium xiaoi TaxID=659607 RepID=A0AAV9XSZ1_9CRYT